ncbi:glucokinase [Microbulbifer yueqingensis]|uniref:Glucokinase n=1 Tax=Microbulbifer yueqingensis TaxID=658219 RepID=A0A1G8YA70_9GAMM|nr:glucokinase [Microbulbifer yueqingensis]SDJ99135.1 glucokinase [Microbulbifer yueqingensis]
MTSIVADIGGTNARFAIATPTASGYALEALRVVNCREFGGFDDALQHWLGELEQPVPRRACIACAGPVEKNDTGGKVYMTNLGWHIDAAGLRVRHGLAEVQLMNDFAALALSLPLLGDKDFKVLRDAPRVEGATMAVLGPGTGLGVAGLIRADGRHHVVAGEGGHANLPVSTERELQLLGILLREQQPVFNEWILSGSGLVNLYRAVCELNGHRAEALTPPDVSARGLEGTDPMCRETLIDFLNLLGATAGDVAAYFAARGGIFLGGGILPRIETLLPESEFEQRFLAKGRLRDWMLTVPVYTLNAGFQALLGAAAQLDR